MQVYDCEYMKEWRFEKTVLDKTKEGIRYSHQDNTNILTYAQSILLNEN
jgi:hypothetical protein